MMIILLFLFIIVSIVFAVLYFTKQGKKCKSKKYWMKKCPNNNVSEEKKKILKNIDKLKNIFQSLETFKNYQKKNIIEKFVSDDDIKLFNQILYENKITLDVLNYFKNFIFPESYLEKIYKNREKINVDKMKFRKEIADKNYDLLLKINNDIIEKYESLESNSKNNKFIIKSLKDTSNDLSTRLKKSFISKKTNFNIDIFNVKSKISRSDSTYTNENKADFLLFNDNLENILTLFSQLGLVYISILNYVGMDGYHTLTDEQKKQWRDNEISNKWQKYMEDLGKTLDENTKNKIQRIVISTAKFNAFFRFELFDSNDFNNITNFLLKILNDYKIFDESDENILQYYTNKIAATVYDSGLGSLINEEKRKSLFGIVNEFNKLSNKDDIMNINLLKKINYNKLLKVLLEQNLVNELIDLFKSLKVFKYMKEHGDFDVEKVIEDIRNQFNENKKQFVD